MVAAVREALYLKQLLEGLGIQTETYNSSWRGQPELHQIVPNPSRIQEELTHGDKISLHSGQDGR